MVLGKTLYSYVDSKWIQSRIYANTEVDLVCGKVRFHPENIFSAWFVTTRPTEILISNVVERFNTETCLPLISAVCAMTEDNAVRTLNKESFIASINLFSMGELIA